MNNTPINIFDFLIFLREKVASSEISFSQFTAMMIIASRNDRSDHVITQQSLARDLNVDVSNLRALLKPLIEKNIIISKKDGREDHYSITTQYRTIMPSMHAHTLTENSYDDK